MNKLRPAGLGQHADPDAPSPGRARHIVFVISSLSSGGAERVATTMANFWTEHGDDVSIVTWVDTKRIAPFYPLHPRVRTRALDIAKQSRTVYQRITQTARRIRALRETIKDLHPDVVISFMSETNVTTLLATMRQRVPVIVSERTDPGAFPSIGRVMERLRRWLYPRAAAVVVQTERAAGYFAGLPPNRLHVLPNPVTMPPEAKPGELEIPRPCLIAIGRLAPEKGFDMLLDAFAMLHERHPDWSLVILGEGELRPQLEAQCARLQVTGSVLLPGRTADPFSVLRQSDIFVLSSRVEGFPNALCEAMAAGLPVVAMDCPSGPREIVRDGVDGLLVHDRDAAGLYRALDTLIEHPEDRARLAKSAPEILQRFSLEAVMAMWEAIMVPMMVDRIATPRRRTG